MLKPITYKKFYSSLSAEYRDYKQGDFGGFNLSCGTHTFKIKEDTFNLCAIRYGINMKRFHEEHKSLLKEMIPGNRTCYGEYDLPQYEGRDFWWNNWSQTIGARGCKDYFIGKINNDGTIIEYQSLCTELNSSDVRIIYLKTIKRYSRLHSMSKRWKWL